MNPSLALGARAAIAQRVNGCRGDAVARHRRLTRSARGRQSERVLGGRNPRATCKGAGAKGDAIVAMQWLRAAAARFERAAGQRQ